MLQDPVIKRIRETRHKISEMFDHNPKKYIDFLKQEEKRHLNVNQESNLESRINLTR